MRSGYVAANNIAIGPPSEMPNRTARSERAASITARRSSIRVSRLGSSDSATRSERPTPRLSNRIRRDEEASRSRNLAIEGSSQSRESGASLILECRRAFRSHVKILFRGSILAFGYSA